MKRTETDDNFITTYDTEAGTLEQWARRGNDHAVLHVGDRMANGYILTAEILRRWAEG